MKSYDKFDNYQDFLDATHAKNITPEELINKVVQEVQDNQFSPGKELSPEK